jgi:hypothetical protein
MYSKRSPPALPAGMLEASMATPSTATSAWPEVAAV